MEKGFEKGIEKGKDEEKIRVAKRLLKKEISIEEVKEITALSESEIKKLKEKIEK